MALNHFRRRGVGLFSRNERNEALGFMKGRGLMDTTFESAPEPLPKHYMQPILKILLDLFNAKSALIIGDLFPSMFPEAAIHASAPHWT